MGRPGRRASAFPDDILPYRPTTTTVPYSSLVALLGEIHEGATDIPALSGKLAVGRPLASVGEETVAAEGERRTVPAPSDHRLRPDDALAFRHECREGLWRRLIPRGPLGPPAAAMTARSSRAASQLAVAGIAARRRHDRPAGPLHPPHRADQLHSPQRLDKREWAGDVTHPDHWPSRPGPTASRSLLRAATSSSTRPRSFRGSARPRASPRPISASSRRHAPRISCASPAVPSCRHRPTATSSDGTAAGLDVLQGDPSRVRDLGVGFGSLRAHPGGEARRGTTRPDGPAAGGWASEGTVTNASEQDAPGAGRRAGQHRGEAGRHGARPDDRRRRRPPTRADGQRLSDKVVGPLFFSGDARRAEARPGSTPATRSSTAHVRPQLGLHWPAPGGGCRRRHSDRPRALLPVEIEGEVARRSANVLWFLPADGDHDGRRHFREDLMRITVVSNDAAFFNKDASILPGRGQAELSFRPISFDGSIDASQLALVQLRRVRHPVEPRPVKPLDQAPVACGAKPVEAVSSGHSTASRGRAL